MGAFGGFFITNKGRALQAKAQIGTPLQYTRIAIGDGSLNGQTIPDLTGLISLKKTLAITGISTKSGGKAVISTKLQNKDITAGFYLREMGVFAQDPDVGEILYCYANAGTGAEYIPPSGGADIVEQIYNINTIVGNAANVSAVIDESLVLATKTELNNHKTANVLDHPDSSVTDNKIGDRTISDTSAPTGNTGKLTVILGWMGNMIKSVTGEATWRTAPGMTIKAIKTLLDAATAASTANTMIKRDAAGRAKVAAPSATDDIARKAETDAAMTVAQEAQNGLTTHSGVTNGAHGSTSAATANRIMQRDAAGRAKVAAPSAADDIARKDTVDTALSDAKAYAEAALRETSSIPVQITTGPNVIETTQATPATVEFKGRTLVNLLGKDGYCENINTFEKWGTVGASSTVLDTTRSFIGGASLKLSVTAGHCYDNKNYPFKFDQNKNFILVAKVFVESAGAVADIVVSLRDYNTMAVKYSSSANKSDTGRWQTLYVKVPKSNTIIGDGFNLVFGLVGTSTGVVNYDAIRLYEVSDADYAAIGTTIVGDAIDQAFPYVDSVQHAQGLSVRAAGKNLLGGRPNITSTQATASQTKPYEITFTHTAASLFTTEEFAAFGNRSYTISISAGVADRRMYIVQYDAQGNKSVASDIVLGGPTTTHTFVTGATTARLRIHFGSAAAGTFVFSNWMLVLGGIDQLPPSFEPRIDQYINAPTLLASNVDGSIADTYDSATKQVFRRWFTGVKFDASITPLVHNLEYVGYKRIYFPITAFTSMLPYGRINASKYNGTVIKDGNSELGADQWNIGLTHLWTAVSNTDTGWVDGVQPSVNAAKALLNGWKATANNGTAYTSWVSILTGSAPPTNTEAYVSANKAPGWDAWATLDYVRATPITESLSGDLGGISLPNGATQVELLDGVIVREKANPKFDQTRYRINNTYQGNSKLTWRAASIVEIFKNDMLDNKWTIVNTTDSGYANGVSWAHIMAADYDPTAVYTVTYRVLDRHQYTAGARQAVVTYQSSLGSVVAKNTQNIAELLRKDGVQDFALDYIEAKADNNAIDLVTTRTDLSTHTALTNGAHGATSAATANRIIQRDANGRAKVAAPSASDDIARKAETDAALTAANAADTKVGDIATLQTTSKNNTVAAINELFQNVSDGKTKVASAITDMGQTASGSDTFEQLTAKIRDISKNASAVAADVLPGKTFYAGGVLQIGTMPVGTQIFTPGAAELIIPTGYYAGSKVAAVSGLTAANIKQGSTVGGVAGNFTNDADAVASELLTGKSAYVKGNKVTGNMANRTGHVTGQSSSVSGTTLRIRPQPGYYPGDAANSAQLSDANFLAANIRKGTSIFGLVGSLVEGVPKAVGIGNVDTNSILTVEGLDFRPGVILIDRFILGTGNDYYYRIYSLVYGSFNEASLYSQGASPNQSFYITKVSPFNITNSGFSAFVGGGGSISTGVNWMAFR